MAIFLVSKSIDDLHTQAINEFTEGNFKNLDLLHHMTAGVKSFATEMCYNGLDELRQSCGGAGFLLSSGLSDWWSDIAPFPTFEGVNPVMAQQASRLIFKNADKVAKGKQPLPIFEYLSKSDELTSARSAAKTASEFATVEHIEQALAVRAAVAIKEVREAMKASPAHKKVQENEIFATDISRMTRLHLIYVTFKMGRKRLEGSQFTDLKVQKHLFTGLKIFALKQLLSDN